MGFVCVVLYILLLPTYTKNNRSKTTEWLATYETLTQMVVPRSATKIAEDDEYVLYTTTLFQRVVDEFTQKARDLKCVFCSL